MSHRSDDTVIIRPAGPRRRGPVLGAIVGVALLASIGTAYWVIEAGTGPVPPPTAAVPQLQPVPATAIEPIPTATEAAIAAESPAVRTVLRSASNPVVVVIDFPTLAEQGRMLNRLAAWAEKAGVAHDQVPSEATVAAAIASSGTTPETYYFGHDYSIDTIKRFFALAAAEQVSLRPEEEIFQRIVARAAAEPAGVGAVITTVRADAANAVSPQARATILHHELSHGEYFTNPAYAAFVTRFWERDMSALERAAVRGYLAQEGYDPALDDLIRNEMQAYLMHTPDPAFFQADRVGISAARLAELRATFLAGMPAGWLRDALAASGTVPMLPPVPSRIPARPRRRQRAGRVSIGSAATATLPPRRRSASTAALSAGR